MATRNAASRKIEPNTANPNVEATPEDAERIGTLRTLTGEIQVAPQEVVVGAPEETLPEYHQRQRRMVTIRVNENVEEMSYVGGGRREQYTFEAGHQYRVPVEIASELERIGKVWH